MTEVMRFAMDDGTEEEVPRSEVGEFQKAATEHDEHPDEIQQLRVTGQDGRAEDIEVPTSEMEDFKAAAGEHGDTFTPLRTVEMANGTRKTMTVGELSKFLRSKEYLESEDHKASVQQQEEQGLTQGSVGLAGTVGALEGLVKGGWYGGSAVANKIAKAIPEVGVEIEKAIGNLAKGAGNITGSDRIHDVGDWLVRDADDAKVWLDKNLPSETAEWSGYGDWSTKVADKIGEVADMAYKFAPGLAPKAGGTVLEKALAGGNNKLMETIFASDGVNAYAQTYDTAVENGATPTQAAAEGGAAFLINYFGQKAMIKAGGLVDGVKNPALRFAGGAAATGDAMGVLGVENKALQNIAENKPVGEGVVDAFAEGTVEGVLFHSMNAVPGMVMGAMKSRADRKMYDEIARTEILEALKRPEGSAALAGLMDKEAGDAAIAAYKDSSSEARTSGVEGPKREEVRRLAIEAWLPETMTTAEMYRVLDAVAQQRQALDERVRTQMSDEQADALAQAVEAEIVKGVEPGQPAPTGKDAEELFQKTWLRTVEKIQDAAVLDDPEMRKSLVETARKQAASEIRNDREAEAQELSRIRGASLGDQLAEFERRGIATWEDAEADGLIGKDERGRWAGGARQALNIELHGTEKMKDAVKEGKLDGDLAEELITASYLDLGGRPPEERAAMIDRIIDQADGNAAEARLLLNEVSPSTARTSGLPETAYEGAINADRMKGTELKTIDGGVMGVQRFPEVRVEISADGITVDGLTDELMSKPENAADVAALLTRLNDIAERNNLMVDLGDANAKAIAFGMIDEIQRGGLEATQRKMDTRARLFKVLADTTLGNGTTFDEQSFRTALAETGNGRRWVDNHGNIYGFVDDKGVIHFNPATFSMNTPIHEYGHVALEAVKRINPKLWERGMELIEGTAYLDEIERYSKTDGHEYSYLRGNSEAMKDEALATMIGDRGEKLVVERGLEAKLKEWIKEVWKAFKEAFGVADLTDEQIEKMSIDDFVNVMNAELLRGREFGLKNRRNSTLNRKPLTKARSFEQHYQLQEEQEAAAEAERWAKSGMNAKDYILSRVEEGEPAFDLDWETAREIANDASQGRFSIGGLYTGSAADYEKPSLLKVGTGEGSQVYGWGLYASDRRDVAEVYSTRGDTFKILKDGKEVSIRDDDAAWHIGRFAKGGSVNKAKVDARARIKAGDDPEFYKKVLKDISAHKYEIVRGTQNIYEQTFFTNRAPGDESHLLKWYEPVSEENLERIKNELSAEGIDKKFGGMYWLRHHGMSKFIESNDIFGALLDNGTSGDAVYETLALIVGGPKEASEFLARADIDGIKYPVDSYGKTVKDGDKAGWNYVSFRDDNIRVDHKWRDGQAVFSAARNDIMSQMPTEWKSRAYEMREQQLWTTHPEGVKGDVLWALSAITPEKHHIGSESHGQDVILESVYPPDYKEDPFVKFASQFSGNKQALKLIRDALYLKYGSKTNSRKLFDKYDNPDTSVVPKVDKKAEQIRFDQLLAKEKDAYAKRQAIQKEIGYPAYKDDERWIKLNADYENFRKQRLNPSPEEQQRQDRLDEIYRRHKETADERFESYKKSRIEEADKILEEVADENGAQRLDDFFDAKFQAGAAPKLNKSRFIAGRARIAADAEMNERTPGAIAASQELNTWRTRPVSQLGAQRYMSLPIADLEQLRKAVTGQTLPAIVMKNMAGGRLASHTRDGQLIIAADVFGTVDKADMEAEKTTLKAHGFFRNEDPNWCAGQLPGDILREQRRSEDQLATQLLHLGSRRARGQASGGQEGARGVFADEVASIILEQPRQYGGVLGRIQTLGKGVKDAARAILGGNDRAKQEAGAFLDWAYGGQLVDPATGNPVGRSDALTLDQLTSSMFGKWLVMPQKIAEMAPGWSQVFESTIANDKKLSEVFRTLFDQHLHKNDYILRKLKEQQSIETQQAIAQIEQKSDEQISAGSWWKDFKESTLFGIHDRMSPVYLRINDKYRIQIKAMREAIKTASPKDRQALKQSLQLFMGRYGDVMNRLELSRTAYERGGLNQDSIYAREMARLENDAYEKWALSSEDRSLYLEQKRVIETQGRASSFGEDVRTAQMVLDEMKQRLGPQKWAWMEEYGRRFHQIHERYFLDDERAERMWGKALIDYFRSQSDYVTTDRVFSREELDAINEAGKLAKESGVAGNDDVVSQFYTYAGAKGAGEAIGEAAWNGKLSGSFAGKKEVIGATYEKVDRLKRSLRRNQLILDLREALMFAKVDGVRDLPAEKAGDFPAGKRYGHLTYFENGKKRVLVVPKQIADGFGFESQNKWYLKTVNAINRGWRALVIDFNPSYWPMNIMRNQHSIEKNMPGMRETWVKTALRAVSPGLGSASDIVNQALVRNIPAAAKLFSEHTMFFYIPQMERICKIVENMSKWQRKYWDAEASGDLAKVQQMNEDWKLAKRMLDANIFVSVKNAYDGNVSQGFAADALAKKGIKTLEQIDNEIRTKSGMRKILDKIDILHKNQNLQNHEDILAKGCAFLADARLYELKRTDAERGALVNSRVSIAQGERRGAAASFMKNIVPFYNMIEKGVVRHGKAMMEDPKHTLIQDSKSIFGRMTSMMFATGVIQYILLENCDGDEKKAQERYGLLYDYAKAYKTAYQNCSNYIRKNYNITPIWSDGFTSVILGGGMTDEDKLLAPISDFIANTAAYQSGLAEKPSFGSTILDSTVRAVVPDLALTGPIIEGLEVAISAVGGNNPFDYFRDAKKFDQKILDNRFESWEGFKDFAAVAGAELWNYYGGRAIVPANVNGVDNGRGKAPETLETVLTRIPFVSSVINRMVKVQVGSPAKRGQPITEAKSKKDALIEILAASMLDISDEQVPLYEKDPKRYQKKIDQWKADYNLSDVDTAMIKMNYFNAFNSRRCREALDKRKLRDLMTEGQKQGKTKSQMWVILGNM